ncbi:alpha/beta hydrolase family protein [Pelagibius sp.]|uniref:alpha/beta hydrolase family protein n=1 Tax=Pelagibius sp. TaxID=1931238 RepID=UPI003BB1C4F4
MRRFLATVVSVAGLFSYPAVGQERLVLQSTGDEQAQVELFIATPKGDGPWPAILFVHGHQIGGRPGARVFASLEDRPRLATIDEGRLADMAERGYVAAAVSMPGYGGSSGPPDFVGPRTQAAVGRAITYLWDLPSVDRNRIALYGVSRGAATSAMVATRDARLRALILVAGVYDLGERYPTGRPRLDQNIETEAGTTEQAFAERSALRHAGKIKAATLILHGGQDSDVTVNQARRLAAKLRANNVLVRERIFPGVPHQIPIPMQYQEIHPFLESALGS